MHTLLANKLHVRPFSPQRPTSTKGAALHILDVAQQEPHRGSKHCTLPNNRECKEAGEGVACVAEVTPAPEPQALPPNTYASQTGHQTSVPHAASAQHPTG